MQQSKLTTILHTITILILIVLVWGIFFAENTVYNDAQTKYFESELENSLERYDSILSVVKQLNDNSMQYQDSLLTKIDNIDNQLLINTTTTQNETSVLQDMSNDDNAKYFIDYLTK